MKICNHIHKIEDIFDTVTTIPDCFVFSNNKIGSGHGEAKLYLGSKDTMNSFFDKSKLIKCILLKDDLLNYMKAVECEYKSPSQDYLGKEKFKRLFKERLNIINNLNEISYFYVEPQNHLIGQRGYVNSIKNENQIYNLLREISLPLISYIQIMKLREKNGSFVYYWKLFADFETINENKSISLALNYRKGKSENTDTIQNTKNKNVNLSRVGQGLYRSKLLEECSFCPITMVADERLLIASHIKPWAACSDKEKIDPKNGFILTPLYDKLFDRGFITFTNSKKLITSNWISPSDLKRLNVVNNTYYQMLPLDAKRKEYLEYHRDVVFKK